MSVITTVIIDPGGAVSVTDIDPERLSPHIGGGYVERIVTSTADGEEVMLWFDEEGKMKDLPDNPAATSLVTFWLGRDGRGLMPGDVLSGIVVVTGGYDNEGGIRGLSPAAIEFINGYLR